MLSEGPSPPPVADTLCVCSCGTLTSASDVAAPVLLAPLMHGTNFKCVGERGSEPQALPARLYSWWMLVSGLAGMSVALKSHFWAKIFPVN